MVLNSILAWEVLHAFHLMEMSRLVEVQCVRKKPCHLEMPYVEKVFPQKNSASTDMDFYRYFDIPISPKPTPIYSV